MIYLIDVIQDRCSILMPGPVDRDRPAENDAAQAKPKRKKGHFAATGDYLWYAFSDGVDQYKNIYDNLDMRHKVII